MNFPPPLPTPFGSSGRGCCSLRKEAAKRELDPDPDVGFQYVEYVAVGKIKAVAK